jgi:hypothetical protein
MEVGYRSAIVLSIALEVATIVLLVAHLAVTGARTLVVAPSR